jgi:hypothetical protein
MSKGSLLKLQEEVNGEWVFMGDPSLFEELAEVKHRIQHMGCDEEELWWI